MNSGNANACTGEQGIADAREMIALAAAQAGVASEEVAVASTGIIGRPLPMATIAAGIRQLSHSGSPTGFQKAILTTDLVEKSSDSDGDCGPHCHHGRLRQRLRDDSSKHGDNVGIRHYRCRYCTVPSAVIAAKTHGSHF